MGLLVLSCLIQGLSGWRLTSTWGFVALLCALSAHLLMVTYRGLSHSRPYIVRFALIHIGLLLTLAGIFWGAPDTQEWRTIVRQGQSVQTAVDAKGHGTFLPHSLRLIDLDADYAANGMPEQYEARLLIDDSRPATLRVNHPYPISRIDDIYLSAFNPFGPTAKAHCIVQWVHQPWKYVTWTGIWMLIAGSILLFLQGARKQDARKERRMKP